MLSLPFFDQAVPGTSAPAVEITIGGGGESGGLGGLADAAASLLGVGGGAPAWADHLVALRLHHGLAPLVDGAELLIAQTGDAPSAVLGDSCVIRMGVPGALQDFFSGQVTAIEQRTDGLRRYGLGNVAYTLARGRLNQTVTNMRVQEVIAFAADTLGVSLQLRVAGSDGSLPAVRARRQPQPVGPNDPPRRPARPRPVGRRRGRSATGRPAGAGRPGAFLHLRGGCSRDAPLAAQSPQRGPYPVRRRSGR